MLSLLFSALVVRGNEYYAVKPGEIGHMDKHIFFPPSLDGYSGSDYKHYSGGCMNRNHITMPINDMSTHLDEGLEDQWWYGDEDHHDWHKCEMACDQMQACSAYAFGAFAGIGMHCEFYHYQNEYGIPIMGRGGDPLVICGIKPPLLWKDESKGERWWTCRTSVGAIIQTSDDWQFDSISKYALDTCGKYRSKCWKEFFHEQRKYYGGNGPSMVSAEDPLQFHPCEGEDGNYNLIQSHFNKPPQSGVYDGEYWCVDKEGDEIMGTRTAITDLDTYRKVEESTNTEWMKDLCELPYCIKAITGNLQHMDGKLELRVGDKLITDTSKHYARGEVAALYCTEFDPIEDVTIKYVNSNTWAGYIMISDLQGEWWEYMECDGAGCGTGTGLPHSIVVDSDAGKAEQGADTCFGAKCSLFPGEWAGGLTVWRVAMCCMTIDQCEATGGTVQESTGGSVSVTCISTPEDRRRTGVPGPVEADYEIKSKDMEGAGDVADKLGNSDFVDKIRENMAKDTGAKIESMDSKGIETSEPVIEVNPTSVKNYPGCVLRGARANGKKLVTRKVDNMRTCANGCAAHPDCMWWQWFADKKSCRLRGNTTKIKRVKNKSIIAGHKECSVTAKPFYRVRK